MEDDGCCLPCHMKANGLAIVTLGSDLIAFQAWVDCRIASKANSRKNRRGHSGKSDEATAFCDLAIPTIRSAANGHRFAPTDKLQGIAYVRYESYQPDTDVELVWDCLERAGVVPNDRQIRIKYIEAVDDIGPGRVRVVLRKVGTLPWTPQPKKGTPQWQKRS